MIYIAIGANLPTPDGATPRHSCIAAAARLATIPGLRLAALSPWYETPPEPVSHQPNYINGVAALHGDITPEALLATLQTLEHQAGRIRTHPNAARTLDLDIIDLNGLIRDTPDPILPHPRTHLRGFVLHPLRDVAPTWVHPRTGCGVEVLIGALT